MLASALLLQLTLHLASAPDAPTAVAFQERAPLWLALHLPAKEFGSASVSEIVAIADDVIRRHSDFKAKVVPEQLVRTCGEQSGNAAVCLARGLRDDPRPEKVRFLLMMSTIDATHVVSIFVDLQEADRILSEGGDEADLDKAVSERAIVAATLPTELKNKDEIEAYLSEFINTDLTAKLDEAQARLLGIVEVEISIPEGAEVSMDGKRLGSSRRVLIQDVPPGPHVLRLEREGYQAFETQVQVQSREVARVNAELRSNTSVLNRTARDVTFYSGLAVVAAGIAVGAVGVATDPPACFGGDQCTNALLRESLLPVGYSLVGMGAAWSLGAWLGDEDSFPWIELLAGAVIFGVSYGVTIAVADGGCGDGCYDPPKL